MGAFSDLRFDVGAHGVTVFDTAWFPVGHMAVTPCVPGDAAAVSVAQIDAAFRGRGLYPEMLKRARDYVKSRGCAGIISYDRMRSDLATTSWQKFAARDPRVSRLEEAAAFYLDGLPTKGRIPMRTAQRALKRLGSKAKACKITPALLREGMEIEREHRDLTKGRVLDTAKIAAAHICERRDYYKRIKRYVER